MILWLLAFVFDLARTVYSIPVFVIKLIRQPGGRSFFQILANPRYSPDDASVPSNAPAVTSRRIRRRYHDRGKRYLARLPETLYIHSCYQTRGNSMHAEVDIDPTISTLLDEVNKVSYEDPLVFFGVPYTFILSRLKKPPRDHSIDSFIDFWAFGAIYFVLTWIGIYRIMLIRWFPQRAAKLLQTKHPRPPRRRSRHRQHHRRRIALATTPPFKGYATYLFDTDGLTFVMDNSANTHVCRDKLLFVGDLRASNISLDTANGANGPQLQLGTIKVSWQDDNGDSHEYELDDVIFNPKSPFNIISIGRLGQQFGKSDLPPTSDDNGTFIRSSANFSTFTWDHGRFTRTFSHSSDGLPELPVNVGTSIYQTFCTKIRRIYDDSVSYAFATAVIEYDEDEIDPRQPDHDFEFGADVYYRDGNGNNSPAKYLKPVDKNGATLHKIRLEDGDLVETPAAHLTHLEQPDLTNIPLDVDSYCQEIEKGLTKEDIASIARPQSLSPLQQEFLHWHHRLAHIPYHRLIRLAKEGLIPKRLTKLRDNAPICVSCKFGQAHKRPWRTSGKKSNPIRNKQHNQPGDCVSSDQMVSAQPGLVPQMSGFLTSQRIWGVTLFVDHVSDYTYGHLMRSLDLSETLLAKRAFEKLAARAGHSVRRYHTDNGRYADTGFLASINANDQTITMCGVGAHHQNGIVERRIRLITEVARTLLLHAQRHWPECVDTMLWPFAVKAAIERINCLHQDLEGKTPHSKFFGTDDLPLNVQDYHTFGCPVYVLDSRLQSGTLGPPKWEPRSRIGVYLGHSPMHAGSVALVLNPQTGHVSPQFHIVFDDIFSTVSHMREQTIPPTWEDMCKNASESATEEAFDLAESWFKQLTEASEDKIQDPFQLISDQSDKKVSASEGAAIPNLINNSEGANNGTADKQNSSTANTKKVSFADVANDSSKNNLSLANEGGDLGMPKLTNLSETGLRRSERLRKINEKKNQEVRHPSKKKAAFSTKRVLGLFTVLSTVATHMSSFHSPIHPNATKYEKLVHRFHEANELFDGTINVLHNSVLATDANENYTYSQAMKQDDAKDFIEAMATEVEAHESRNHWTMVSRNTLPSGAKTIRAIWSFKRKRYPDGRLNKHKARLCAHGGMQQWGENYWETYSPVVNMLSVRLLLAVAHIHGLDTKSIDFVLAFPQAEIDIDIWMELPEGMDPLGDENNRRGYVLKLNKSLYGLKQASHNWYEKLKQSLIARDFVPSKIDPCIFMKDGMILLVYVDDCIIIADNIMRIDVLIHSLKNGEEKYILTEESTLDKFLGINIERLDEDRFELSQPFLIERIIKFVESECETEVNNKSTPTPVGKPLLHKDLAGKERKYSWNYRTAVGMTGYLQGSTRPEISMANHQCARFVHNPMRSHERAMIRIARYLQATKNRGIIYKPDKTLGLECFVDADFAGGWSQADADNPENVMSRTGFVIRYAGCPIGWCSKLQTEIALSTAEAEYIALSQALREVIPLITLVEELAEIFPLYINKPDFFCKVWEDNQSCIAMTETDKFTPRTKHIALKYHHFRSFVDSKRIRIEYVRSEDQLADILTKPLPDGQFHTLRYLLCGW